MAINQELSTLTPHEAAAAVGVGVQSIRRWCEWHALHLSPGASPGPGVPRRLVARDVEVLKVVKDLRYQGLQTEAINEQLKTMAFPEIADSADSDNAVTVANSVESPADSRQGQAGAIVPKVDAEFITSIERRFEALERSVSEAKQSQREYIQGLAVGFIGAALFFLILLLLISVYHR